MPTLTLSTNISLDGVDTSDFFKEATDSIAKILDRPIDYVMVLLKHSVPMSFGGTEEPAAFGELISIRRLNADTNKKLSAAISSILETKMSVLKSRFYLNFCQVEGFNFGWNGSTCSFF